MPIIATEQYFPVVGLTFTMLHNVVLSYQSVDQILPCEHSNKQNFPVVLLVFQYFGKIKLKIFYPYSDTYVTNLSRRSQTEEFNTSIVATDAALRFSTVIRGPFLSMR